MIGLLILVVAWRPIRYILKTQRPVWLIGENRGECVRDNGYYFYQYCRRDRPKESVYFVMNSSCPYYAEMKGDANVLVYGSLRHLYIFYVASVCIYTHVCSDVLYRTYFEIFGKSKKLVFLHHGVLGFKKFDAMVRKANNLLDVFTVGSTLEMEILAKQEGVDEKKLRLTGYARYDYLENQLTDNQYVISYLPTHRNWISSDFRETEFFHRISSLLNSSVLQDILEENNIVFKLFLHKYMQQYSGELMSRGANFRIVAHGVETPNDLINKSNLLVSDYSSVTWDFFYLGKPVVFYRFDTDRFLEDRGSYVSLSEELLGDVVSDESALIARIKYYVENGFRMEKRFNAYRQSIYLNLDGGCCERIYSEVQSL